MKSETTELHQLINRERRNRGLEWNNWSQCLYESCKRHSNDMARVGRLFHSPDNELMFHQEHADGRIELGNIAECCCGGRGYFKPRDFFQSWMRSPEHRKLLLDDDTCYQAVAISRSGHSSYATWQAEFSDHSLDDEIEQYSTDDKRGFLGTLKSIYFALFVGED